MARAVLAKLHHLRGGHLIDVLEDIAVARGKAAISAPESKGQEAKLVLEAHTSENFCGKGASFFYASERRARWHAHQALRSFAAR